MKTRNGQRGGCGCVIVLALLLGVVAYFNFERIKSTVDEWFAPTTGRDREYDREMDRLGPGLNQQTEQLPDFEADGEKQAVRLYQDGATPLAARCVAHRLQEDSSSPLQEIRETLLERWAWAWRFNGDETIFPNAPQGTETSETDGEENEPIYILQAYENLSLPSSLADVRLPLEHYHFAYFLPDKRLYWGSLTIESEEILGTNRIYILKQITDGKTEVLDIFESLPSFDEAQRIARERLKGTDE